MPTELHEPTVPTVRRWLIDAVRFDSRLRVDERIRLEMVSRWYRFRVLAAFMTVLSAGVVSILGYRSALFALATAVIVLSHAVATRYRPQVVIAICLDLALSFLSLEVMGVSTPVLSLLYVTYAVITLLLCKGAERITVGSVTSAAFVLTIIVDWSDPSIPEVWTSVGSFLSSLVFVLLLVGTVSVAIDILQRHVTEVDESNRRLDALIRSKDSLISTMSHELRTPLTSVMGFASELHDRWAVMDDEERRIIAGLIAAESGEMAHLTEDMVVASRAELGTLYLRLERVDLAEVVEAVLASNPDLTTRISGTGVDVDIDIARLQQVFRALLTNAARFGGAHVWIELGQTEEMGFLRVCDDGEGIPDGHLEDVFLPFERAHENPTQPESFGLGLTVARRLTEAMGGTIEYRRRGDDTVFELMFPRAADVSAVV